MHAINCGSSEGLVDANGVTYLAVRHLLAFTQFRIPTSKEEWLQRRELTTSGLCLTVKFITLRDTVGAALSNTNFLSPKREPTLWSLNFQRFSSKTQAIKSLTSSLGPQLF